MKKQYGKRIVAGLLTLCMVAGLAVVSSSTSNASYGDMADIEQDFKAAFQDDDENLSATSKIITDSNISELENYAEYQSGAYTSLADYLYSFDTEGAIYRDKDAGTKKTTRNGFLYYNMPMENFTLEMEYKHDLEAKTWRCIYVGFGAQQVGENAFTDEHATHIRIQPAEMYVQHQGMTDVGLHSLSGYKALIEKHNTAQTEGTPVWYTLKLEVNDGVATWWIDGYKFTQDLAEYDYAKGLLYIGATKEGTAFRNIKITSGDDYVVYYATNRDVNVAELTSTEMVQTDFSNCWSVEDTADGKVFTRTGTDVYKAPNSKGKGTSLLYFCEQQYEEFDLTLEYATNTIASRKWVSVGFGADEPGKSFLDDDGYMVNIEGDGKISYFYPDETTSNKSAYISADANATYTDSLENNVNQWHTVNITVGNGKMKISYDGGNVYTQEVTDYAGYIYLSCFTDGMQFRNITINSECPDIQGDTDKDGTLNVVDLVRFKKVSDGLGGSNNQCDLNEDTEIDKYDMSIIKRKLLGITSPLEGKKVLFLGDSIAYGGDDIVEGMAWGKRIEAIYGTDSTVAAISGNRLSVGAGKGVIVDQVKNVSNGDSYDYVILHGGVNDVWNSTTSGVELAYGALTSEGTTEFDTTTVYGALEDLIAVTKTKCPNAKLGYVINFNISDTIGDMTDLVQAIKDVCTKWNVPVLDLYNHTEFNAGFDATIHLNTDGVHPIKEGYEYITPYIGEWMETIE